MYVDRKYRERFSGKGLIGFRVVVRDSDLMIMVDEASYSPDIEKLAEKRTLYYRNELEQYIKEDPGFKTSLEPYIVGPGAPAIAIEMVRSGNLCGVGPMAAVAGAIAERVGTDLKEHVDEIIIENGGDLFLHIKQPRIVGIFAGNSPFSDKLALKITPEKTPLGVCTSSGVVGPSLSFGKADAVVITAPSAAMADAAATAVGNWVVTKDDVRKGIEVARKIKGITGALIIKDDRLAGWGDIEIVSWEK